MSYSLYLLTATCLAAAPPEAPPLRPIPAPTVETTPADAPPPSPGLLGRIRNFFTGRRNETVIPTGGVQPATPTVQPGSTPTVQPGATPPMQMGTPTSVKSNLGLPATDKDLDKVGHEKDHSWITGKLFRVAGGRWVLRYAGPFEVDPYQGSVLLAPNTELGKFHDGDLVCVHGRVIGGRAQPYAGALYEAREINAITHPKH
jgi:hypothetical protein